MSRTWEDNAAEFGALDKQGKDVRLALLVACSAERGKGGPKTVTIVTVSGGKTSLREFAELAGSTAPRISRHLAAWERFADAGYVKHAADLVPADALTYVISDEALEHFAHEITLGTSAKESARGLKKVIGELIAESPDFARTLMGLPGVAEACLNAMNAEGIVVGIDPTLDQIIEAINADPGIRDAVIGELLNRTEEIPDKRERGKKQKDYAKLLERALHDITLVLHAVDKGEWEIPPLHRALFYFVNQMMAVEHQDKADIVEAKLNTLFNEIEDYANTGGER